MKKIAYKFGLASSIMLLLGMALSGVALADGGEEGDGEIQTVNGYRVELVFANPARVGENPVHLRVSDAEAQPVTHAEIAVSVVASEAEHDPAAEHGDAGHGEAGPSQDAHDSSADSSAHSGMDMPDDTGAPGEAGILALMPGEEDGEYAGEIVIPQAGAWIIRAHLTIEGAPMMVEFPVAVAPAQNGLGVLTGFFSVNAVILVAAAVLRRRPATKTPQPSASK